ncbi:hypothetical protein [Bifidobacterium scardovii]|jgi:hypothetical protein|uniref:hypothetical protein n=1 Tax=Bifidobacterium scardovii TaxID=158787 RepID=UPI000665D225|nr:hypothetical protein [Bifidobacterium scardovii]MDU3737523.1 hypothetical protein [Bifidobacterium scardovii]MDU5610251.1 hypothetical protein [Bifidobacterium scardovii]DAO75329.1 MAG TPA: HOLLIDAY JUNCTION RESOLVASE HOMOLOGOUS RECOMBINATION [Caudoviricetes sp.]
MSRNRRTAKDNGTRFETAMESYLRWALDDRRINRLRLHGARDIGDLGNVYFHGEPVTIECKWTAGLNATAHMREAILEAKNNDSPFPWVLQKKEGVGLANLRSQGSQLAYTLTTVLERMLTGETVATLDRVMEGCTQIGRSRDITLITVKQFALLINHGLPLEPDE